MKLYKFIVWVAAGIVALMLQYPPGVLAAQTADGQDVKVEGNGAVENNGVAKVEEEEDITLDNRIAEDDEMVTRSIIAAADLRKQNKISDNEWACVKAKLNKASKDIDNAREEYKGGNSEEALSIAESVEKEVTDMNYKIQTGNF